MNAGFSFQPTIGIFALHQQSAGFQPRLFASLLFNHFYLVFVGPRPARIHACHHRRPVLSLSATGSGVYLDIGVIAVGFTGKQRFQFGVAHYAAQYRQAVEGIIDDAFIIFHLGHFNQLKRVGQFGLGRGDDGHGIVELVSLAH